MCTKMKKKQYKQYSEEFKLSVIRDYYSSDMSKYACQKKYELSNSRLVTTQVVARQCTTPCLKACGLAILGVWPR